MMDIAPVISDLNLATLLVTIKTTHMKCKELKEFRKLSSKLAKKIIRTGNPNAVLKKNQGRLRILARKYTLMMHQYLNT